MATISSPGVGSGLDVSTIVTQLMALERKPLNLLETAETKIQSQISEVGKIKSALSKFRDLAAKLASTDFWKQNAGTASNSAVSIATGPGASAADYTVEVQKLAAAQAVATPGGAFASSSALVGAGTLHIEFGAWNATQDGFTPSATATALDVTVTADDTLASLRDKINAAGDGVTASILTDASGARLMLRSDATGTANGFRTSTTGGGALAGLAYDPSPGGVTAATLAQAASNSQATINNLPVTSDSNSLNDVLDGVSLTLNAQTVAPMTLSVKPDTAAMKKTLTDFASAYTELAKLITTDTKYDATSKKAGVLQGDSAIVGLQTRLRAMLGATTAASTAFTRLSDAGFEQQQDGSLTVNTTKLDKALANLPQLQAMFAGSSTTDPSLDGFGKRFRVVASDILGIDGTLTSRTTGLQDKLTRNQKSQDHLEERLAQTQKRLEAQYSALDAKMGTLNSLSSYVTAQIAQWNKA
jgi:flagellar hook-associated protein 2